jgi:glycosyltransferase involved in cell wall biosynthesis
MDPLPLVTVIITTYNYAHTVGLAIDSALGQNYPELEVLVVDNASTDATPELAARYAADPRFRYIRNETNIGMVPNHNKGLRESRGEYVLFLSADDFLLPGHISRSYWYLREHPEVDVLYASTLFVEESGRFIGVRQMGGQPQGPYEGGRNEFAALFAEGCYMCFPTMLMRRDLYERFGELDENIKAADYEIVVRWAANGVRFAYLPEPIAAVRLHSAQQSSPQNYVADAGDIREFVYLVNKFAEASAERLRGFEHTISRHMWGRFEMARQAGVLDAGGELRAEVTAADAVLTRVRERNEAVKRIPHLTVIVLPSNNVGLLEVTLRSVVSQTFADWDAIVLQDSGQSLAPLGAFLDPRGRIRGMRFIGIVNEGAAINNGLRVASGDAFIVLRAGTELTPQHFERALQPIVAGHALAVRTPAVVIVHGAAPDAPAGAPQFERHDRLYMPAIETRMPYVAPFGPIEALVFTRTAVDRVSAFTERIPKFSVWEFLLRLQAQVPLAAADSPVIVHVPVALNDVFDECAVLPAVARAVYNAFGSEDASIRIERDAYLRNLQAVLDGGPAQGSTPGGIAALLRAANGMDLLAAK